MHTISSATQRLLRYAMLKGIGPQALRRIAEEKQFMDASVEQLALNVLPLARALKTPGAWDKARQAAEHQLEMAKQYHARIVSPLDPDYPALLTSTDDDPFLLWVIGCLSPTPDKSVAIIGPREPTRHGVMIASRITTFFVEHGWSVVSGLALGCDAEAHRTALDAGGHTVAVLAHGLQMMSPAKHKSLAERIIEEGGALVSEFPFGQTASRPQFIKRDRTQAGLARGVVMVQSDLKGGSLHATRAALHYKRWIAVPYPTDRDKASCDPKIQANLVIAEGTTDEKIQLLKCTPSELNHITILKGKEDYPQLLENTAASQPTTTLLQPPLL